MSTPNLDLLTRISKRLKNKNLKFDFTEKKILIEGLSTYGIPQYLLNVARILPFSTMKNQVTILFDSKKKSKAARKVLGYFGDFKSYHYFDNFFDYNILFKSVFKTLNFIFCFRKDITSFSIKNIQIGDLIYDTILINHNIPTIKKFKISYLKVTFKSIFEYYSYEKIIKSISPMVLLISHINYGSFGILARLSSSYDVVVKRFGNGRFISYPMKTKLYESMPIPITEIDKMLKDKVYINESEDFIKNRVEGKEVQLDVANSFTNKKILDNSGLSNLLGLSKDYRTKILIAAHVFTDAPHCTEPGLFNDFYEWFVESIKIAKNNPEILYIIKEHPSAHVYNEVGWAREIVYSNELNSDNLRFISSSINTISLLSYVDYTLTYSGTIGIEFACFGIPCILAGKPFYSGYSFTIESKDYNDYVLNVTPVENIKLDSNSIRIAKVLFKYKYDRENHQNSNEFSLVNETFTRKMSFMNEFNTILEHVDIHGFSDEITQHLLDTIF